MDKHYTPLNIEKLKKQYFTKKSNKLDMILIILGLLTIIVQAVLLFVLIQKKTRAPEPVVTQEQPTPTVAPTEEPPSPTPASSSAALKSATESAKTTTVVPTKAK